MGKRDIGGHETKKPKKDAKKALPVTIIQPVTEVEVIRKGKKPREDEGEE